MKVTIKGGLAVIHQPDMRTEALIRNNLVFKKYNYHEKTYSDLRCYTEAEGSFFVPRHFLTKYRIDAEQTYDVTDGYHLPAMDFKGGRHLQTNFRGVDQEAFVQEIVDKAPYFGGGYGIAPCGSGKTFMGLEIIRRMERSALVIVPLSYQVKQWHKEFGRSYSYDRIGTYQQKKKDSGREAPIVVGTMQSLIKEHNPQFFKTFGTVVFDEGHHLPAATWMSMLARLRSRFIFALTASFHRTDGLENLFRVLLGTTLSEAHTEQISGGTVEMLQMPVSIYVGVGDGNISQISSRLARHPGRNRIILDCIRKVYFAGRDILVYSKRKNHLRSLGEAISQDIGEDKVGYFMGGISKPLLDEALKRRVTFITYDIGKEGVDAPAKDCIVCATPPPSNLKQLKGRIDRVLTGVEKKPPLIIDPVDRGSGYERRARGRVSGWRKEGLAVKMEEYAYAEAQI